MNIDKSKSKKTPSTNSTNKDEELMRFGHTITLGKITTNI
jgi:hypothetical protein